MEGLTADGVPGPREPDPDLPAAEACPSRHPCLPAMLRRASPGKAARRQPAWKEGRAAWEASGQGLTQLQPFTGCVTWGKILSLSEPGFPQVSKMDGFYVWPPVETHFLGDFGCLA